LAGVPTGEASGIDVLDVDPAGAGWYDRHFSALPLTQAHATRRDGLHLLFWHAAGLRCSQGRIAPGVDVRADGGYVIWWPREGLPAEDWPICEWPDWLLALARGTERVVPKRTLHVQWCGVDGEGGAAGGEGAEALARLDVTEFRDHDRWLRLMMACRRAGIAKEDFVGWSVADPLYAGDAGVIERRWDSVGEVGAITAETLWREVRLAELKRDRDHGCRPTQRTMPTHGTLNVQGPFRDARRDGAAMIAGAEGTAEAAEQRVAPTRSVRGRVDAILRGVRGERELFNAACSMREMIAERKLAPRVAVHLLRQAASGMEPEAALMTIASGFRTVELKLMEKTNER
jgi:hypothetical protein